MKKRSEFYLNKRGLSELINVVLLVFIVIVLASIFFIFAIDFIRENSEVSSIKVDLLQETAKIKKAKIDPDNPNLISITLCCAEGKMTSDLEKRKKAQEPIIVDIGLVIDRSDSMNQSGWTMELDPDLTPIATYKDIPVPDGDYNSIPTNFTVPLNSEALAILVEWVELPSYYGSQGSEILTNPRTPEGKRIFGQNKPNNANSVDPPYDVGSPEEHFSGMITLPQITYIENPLEGEWEASIYGWELKPTDNPPPLQYVNVTAYVGTFEELKRNPTVISFEAAKEAAKEFINLAQSTDQISLTTFAKFSELESTLSKNKFLLLEAVDLIEKQPNTNISSGIQTSREDFISNSRTDARKVMILLTDGQNDEGPDQVIAEAQKTKSEGIQIYTIGLSGFVDEAMLKEIATDPSYYYFAPDASQLKSIFEKIRKRISLESTSTPLSDGLKVVFYNGTHSYSPEEKIIDLLPLETKTYSFNIEGKITNVEKFEIYPVGMINGKEIIGPLLQTYTFQ